MTEQKRKQIDWTPERVDTLRAMVATHSTRDIAQHFHCTPVAVRRKLEAIGISLRQVKSVVAAVKPPSKKVHTSTLYRPRRWTESEELYLARYYGARPTRDIARHLKRSVQSVRQRARKIGVHDEVIENAMTMMNADAVAAWLGISPATVGSWRRQLGFPYEPRIHSHVTYESAVIDWLRTDANVLRLTRDAIEPRLQRLYDAVRREHYTLDELNALDVPALMPRRWKSDHASQCDVSIPKAIIIGRSGIGTGCPARLSRTTYYRKDEVRAWAYAFAYIIPESVKHADIADVVLAWQSRYVLNAELYALIPQHNVSNWYTSKGFPRQVKFRMYYDRLEVVAWCKANGHADIARALYRGVPLCYDEVIRERERRHA